MNEDPSLADQRAFYDNWNLQHRRGDFQEIDQEIRIRAERMLELLGSAVTGRPRILEVGCGTGWMTGQLAGLGDTTAIDLSPAAIALARARGIDAEFIADDFLTHPFEPQGFGVVVCIETLFYVVDQRRFIEKLAEVLQPGGLLAVTTINKFVYDRRAISALQPGQVRNWLTMRQTTRLLESVFDVLLARTVEPRGSRGILRIANSSKLDAMLRVVGLSARARRLKERLGLGGGIVLLARKPV